MIPDLQPWQQKLVEWCLTASPEDKLVVLRERVHHRSAALQMLTEMGYQGVPLQGVEQPHQLVL